MRRLVVAGALAALATASPLPQAGVGKPVARSSQSGLLETLTVPGSGAQRVVSRTQLRQGQSYRLVVTGTVTLRTQRPEGTREIDEDALYCFAHRGVTWQGTVEKCQPSPPGPLLTHPLAFLVGNAGPRYLDELAGAGQRTPLPYNAGHRYEVSFRAPADGALTAVTQNYERSGAFRVEIHGGSAASAPSCPALRVAGGLARAAAACRWVVNFRVRQDGDPASSLPRPSGRFVGTETLGVGKVFFNAQPRWNRATVGSPAGSFIHTDTYQSAVNPFLFREGEVRFKPQGATYRQDAHEIRLVMHGVITSVTGVSYHSPSSIEEEDPVQILLVADLPFHREDRMLVTLKCRDAGPVPSPDCSHFHLYRVSSRDKLRVSIGRPYLGVMPG